MAGQGTGDRRTRRTRQALEQALLELMEEQSYEAITIQQIVDRANIGRATFYLHYPDGKEQLLLATMQELTDDFVKRLPTLSGQDLLAGDRRLLIADFEHVARYRRLYRALLGEHGPAFVTRRMRNFLAQQIEQRVVAPLLREAPEGSAPLVPTTFLASYLSGGFLAAVTWWLDRDCPESPEEMALLVQSANRPVLLQTLSFDTERGACGVREDRR
jgi:AcrR family transcriptional regulator